MKKYLIILLIALTTLTGCATQDKVSNPDNQMIISNVRGIYLTNAIGSIDNDIFNKITIKSIVFNDIDQLILVQNEVPFLKANLSKFDMDVRKAFRKTTVKYQNILNKYSEYLEFPIAYPDAKNYYAIEKPGIEVLFDNYGDLINEEINDEMNELFEDAIKEYDELSTNYNIYCESLEALNRQSLSQIDTDIAGKLKKLFLDNIYSSILASEKSCYYEKNSFEPNKIIITR
jgi:hypothetical protein